MTKHTIGTREQWLEARMALLAAEKDLTRRSDALAQQRQALPWVRIDKSYTFDTERGAMTLADLFAGRSQLMIYHFMFGPQYKAGCPSCSAIADGFNGIAVHLAHHDTMLWAVSRAPLAKLAAYRQRLGWTFPWASSYESDFNQDFLVTFDERQQREGGIEYNYRREPPMKGTASEWTLGDDASPVARIAATTGTDAATYTRERPGMSTFVREDGAVYHAYSTFSRGLDALWSMYQWLDRAPLGRNETDVWWRRNDEYGEAA